eukprot:m.477517 g.477517  ORF g.477517 m.477517 type:complete len:145 (+) comp43908_c0_seq1:22-456(+)
MLFEAGSAMPVAVLCASAANLTAQAPQNQWDLKNYHNAHTNKGIPVSSPWTIRQIDNDAAIIICELTGTVDLGTIEGGRHLIRCLDAQPLHTRLYIDHMGDSLLAFQAIGVEQFYCGQRHILSARAERLGDDGELLVHLVRRRA